MATARTIKIFLSYAHADEAKVADLYKRLKREGFEPWMDKEDILPGEDWRLSIKRAIQRSDFFIACLSANSIGRRGEIQREIKSALEQWQGMLRDDIYFIPVRLEDGDSSAVPEELSQFQWVDLFKSDGFEKLVKAIQAGMAKR